MWKRQGRRHTCVREANAQTQGKGRRLSEGQSAHRYKLRRDAKRDKQCSRADNTLRPRAGHPAPLHPPPRPPSTAAEGYVVSRALGPQHAFSGTSASCERNWEPQVQPTPFKSMVSWHRCRDKQRQTPTSNFVCLCATCAHHACNTCVFEHVWSVRTRVLV